MIIILLEPDIYCFTPEIKNTRLRNFISLMSLSVLRKDTIVEKIREIA